MGVGVSFGAAEYEPHHVDLLLEAYGPAASFARARDTVARGTPEEQLLAIFDVFHDRFQ